MAMSDAMAEPRKIRSVPAVRTAMDDAAPAPKFLQDVKPAPAGTPPAVRPDLMRDSFASTAFGDVLDRSVHATFARFSGGLSLAALSLAYTDWAVHLAGSPGKRLQLFEKAVRKQARLGTHLTRCLTEKGPHQSCIAPLPQDRRFTAPEWQTWPFNTMYQSFLLQQQWWHNATTGVRGVTKQHENVVSFMTRQVLDTMSPSNFLFSNPEVLARTAREGGMNLFRGAQNFVEDWERAYHGKRPLGSEAFAPGQTVAVSPGKVVYRNRLIELIQYAPTTDQVRPEPILIVPAWIMKYYILDLSPQNSMVKFLTDAGFTVFMISWKNPGPEDRDLGLEDYRALGVMAALDAVTAITGQPQVHATGYCLGGTLLAIASAAMARDGDHRLATMTLLAAQTDFKEAGELLLFVDESQLALLDDIMWEQGFLDASQMAGAFQMLRSADLIWSRVLHDYLIGQRRPLSDLMAWNADTTRMPYRMHSEYLRQLFLNNDLAEGHYMVGGASVALSDVKVPIFAVATTRDHVAPWVSVYHIQALTDSDVTFVLTEGGHNAGIVADPARLDRSFQIREHKHPSPHVDTDTWQRIATRASGSWWLAWRQWLERQSGAPVAHPPMGALEKGFALLADAPGTYVHQA
jgi:polyhydroxyalkanoate synthase subunit PhaC